MIRQEAILQSPLRVLDRALRGGLGKGHLGVIMAPEGVGKSACLVQIGLDALLRRRSVLHVALGQSVDHVATRYDALFDDLAARVDLADRGGVREAMGRRRLIWSSAEGTFGPRTFDEALAAFQANVALGPATVLVDDLDWSGSAVAETLAGIRAGAARAGAETWLTAREGHGLGRDGRLGSAPGSAPVVDVVLLLEPRGRHARLRLVRDFERVAAADVPLVLEGGALRPSIAGESGPRAEPPPRGELHAEDCTLLALGSAGAEEEFGACAERWGVQEVNFTFPGRRELARTRGLVELSEEDLRIGEVSPAYVKAHLHRAYSESPALRRVLQTIWHQVSTAGEVFAVGGVNPDKTAQGGTGWAVELARHWARPVHLFDQDRRRWFRWDGRDWAEEAPPAIGCERFAGAGTRSLSPDGRLAIRALFERSFGPPSA